MLRLFFALQPPLDLGQQIIERASPLFAALRTQPAAVSNLHATLCFLGAVAPERLAALRAVASSVRAAPMELDFDAFEFWEQPKVLVAVASRQPNEVNALSAALHDVARGAGFSPDQKPFRAHLTLARKICPTDAEKISWPKKISPGFVVRCEKFSLMASTKSEHGSIYSVIDSWRLYASDDR